MSQRGNVANFHSYMEAYEHYFKPLCREIGMPQMAFDILMFLANNPEACTARDISRDRGFKENILSININKLVNEGYLERSAVEGDRRKIRLNCTPKAQPVIERGHRLQESFTRAIKEGISEEEFEVCQRCLDIVGQNARRILQGKSSAGLPEREKVPDDAPE